MAAALRARGPHPPDHRRRLPRRPAPLGVSGTAAGGVFFQQGREDADPPPGTEVRNLVYMIICRKDAKAQRKTRENKTREIFASLRLCGKRYLNLSLIYHEGRFIITR